MNATDCVVLRARDAVAIWSADVDDELNTPGLHWAMSRLMEAVAMLAVAEATAADAEIDPDAPGLLRFVEADGDAT